MHCTMRCRILLLIVLVSKSCQVCGVKTDNRCSRCATTFYCCQDHQKEDWKCHKKSCGRIITKTDESTGEVHVEAVVHLDRGSVVLYECPIFCSPLVLRRGEDRGRALKKENYLICVTCGVNMSGFPSSQCSICQWPVCAEACEKHKMHADNECRILASKKIYHKDFKSRDDFFIIGSLRCLSIKQRSPGLWKELVKLMDLPKSEGVCTSQVTKQNVKVSRILKKLDIYDAEAIAVAVKSVVSPKSFCNFKFHGLSRMQLNGQMGTQDKINNYMYLTAGNLKQSCEPNCFWSIEDFPYCHIVVRSARPIKVGETLTIPTDDRHIGILDNKNLYEGTLSRQFHLWSGSQKICECPRCMDPTEFGSYFSAMACHPCQEELKKEGNNNVGDDDYDPNLGYYLLKDPFTPSSMDETLKNSILWRCNRCGDTAPYADFSKEMTECSLSVLMPKDAGTVANLKKVIGECSFLHPNHYILQIAKNLLITAEGGKFGDFSRFNVKIQRQKARNERIQLCRELLDVQDKILNGSWTKKRACSAAWLAQTLIKNYCQSLDELEDYEVRNLLAEVEEGIQLLEEAILTVTKIELFNQKSNKPAEWKESIKTAQALRDQILFRMNNDTSIP